MIKRFLFCYFFLFCALVLSAQQCFEPRWSLKNNLLYDLTLTPNVGVETVLDSAHSLQLFYGLHPWTFSEGKKLRHWSLMPEWRHWFSHQSTNSSSAQTTRLTGWFWGVHFVGGEYNAGSKELPFSLFKPLLHNRYEGWYGGGGLTLGHAWRISGHWRLEAALGLGYVHSRYHQYEAKVCGEDLGTGHYNYVGPTKLALNLAYDLGRTCTESEQPSQPIEAIVTEPLPTASRQAYQPHYLLVYRTPEAELEKTRQLSGRAFLDFVVNKTDIRPDYRGNAAELAKVLQTIDVVRRDSFTTITHISIHGYASPESPYQHNAYLAQARAEAFAAYVRGLISLPQNLFTIESTPEDWEGLIARLDSLTEPVDISLRAVQAIASDQTLSPDAKEQQLKRKYPKEWRYMLEKIFPALRHSDYEVAYTVRPFTVEEAARVIREKPQHLSLNEMMLVANTYAPGSQDYIDVFETAVRMFPNDETANLNAAVIALDKEDLAAAARYLAKAGTAPEAVNARAVLAIRQKRYEEAELLLRKCNLPEARHNLEELHKYLETTD